MITFIISTRNDHKVQEIRGILSDCFQYLTLKEFPGAPVVKEDASTFAGNATRKSVALARWISARHLQEFELKEGSGLFVLADDSGLEVDELDSAPGVYSARFAALDGGDEGNSPDAANNAKLLKLLKNVRTERRTARFRCVIALTPVLPIARQTASPVCDADEFEMQTQLFDGTCEGRISYVPSGDGGFGYDPLFVPVGYQESFAQLGEAVKGRISHRAKALAALREKIKVKSVA